MFGGLGRPVGTALSDLWHWNGELSHPKWSQVAQPSAASVATGAVPWPPAWENPLGWASDASAGELWISGESGSISGSLASLRDDGQLQQPVCSFIFCI